MKIVSKAKKTLTQLNELWIQIYIGYVLFVAIKILIKALFMLNPLSDLIILIADISDSDHHHSYQYEYRCKMLTPRPAITLLPCLDMHPVILWKIYKIPVKLWDACPYIR